MSYPNGSNTFTLGPWPKGINNVEDETRLGKDELRDAENMVISDQGTVETRPGLVKLVDATSAFSLFPLDFSRGVYFDAGELWLFDVFTKEKVSLGSGFARGVRASWVRIGPRLFFTNGKEHGRIHIPTLQVLPGFGTVAPGLDVTVSALPYGSLAAGRYFLGFTFVDSFKEESGCPRLSFIETIAGIRITFAGEIPAGVEKIRIYATGANGDRKEMYRVGEVDASSSGIDFISPEYGAPLRTLFLSEIPVPDLITAYNGYLFFAIGNEVFHSESQRFGLYHEDHNSVGIYAENVTVLERGQDGLWVVADRTHFYLGDIPKNFELNDNVFNYPAVKFSGCQIDGSLFGLDIGTKAVPYWFSSRGAVLGLPSGKILPVSKGRAEPDFFGVGASGAVEFNGITSVVTALDEYKSPNDSLQLQDSFSVRVINRGIER